MVESEDELTEIDGGVIIMHVRKFLNKHLREWKENGVPREKLGGPKNSVAVFVCIHLLFEVLTFYAFL